MTPITDSAFYAYHVVTSVWTTIADTICSLVFSIIERIQLIAQCIFPIPDMPEHGFVGGDLFAKNVRILFVNGLRYNKNSCYRAAFHISQIFNSALVHYTYIPLTLPQIVQSIAYGSRPNGCQLLLQNIKQHLQELHNQKSVVTLAQHRKTKDPEQKTLAGGERLIVIVHSGGGAMLEAIQNDLTEEERDRIDVISFGSAHLFRHDYQFRQVVNVVAHGDPVPYISDLFYLVTRQLRELMKPPYYVGEPENRIRLEHHSFLGDAYQETLKGLKEEYELEMMD